MLSEATNGIGLITFNQPEKRNAMSVEMWDGLKEILDGWADDDAVRVVVLTGAGDKAFVSGADISQFAANRAAADTQREYDRLVDRGRKSLAAFPKPLIAAIGGFCLGAGLGIALQADIRIAHAESAFGIPAAKLGIAYGFDSVSRLSTLVGRANAALMLYSGRRLDATEALRIGLINRVVPRPDLVDEVTALALEIANNAPLSVRGMKLIIDQVWRDPGDREMAAAYDAFAACLASDDYREGRAAFMQKRAPVFTGR
jgi:enoyl-CoA hydratase/carnithine racemase